MIAEHFSYQQAVAVILTVVLGHFQENQFLTYLEDLVRYFESSWDQFLLYEKILLLFVSTKYFDCSLMPLFST